MAKIVITSDANFLYIKYNTITSYARTRKIRKALWADTVCLAVGDGIEIIISGGSDPFLQAADVDSVNADTDVQTDAKLVAALEAIM